MTASGPIGEGAEQVPAPSECAEKRGDRAPDGRFLPGHRQPGPGRKRRRTVYEIASERAATTGFDPEELVFEALIAMGRSAMSGDPAAAKIVLAHLAAEEVAPVRRLDVRVEPLHDRLRDAQKRLEAHRLERERETGFRQVWQNINNPSVVVTEEPPWKPAVAAADDDDAAIDLDDYDAEADVIVVDTGIDRAPAPPVPMTVPPPPLPVREIAPPATPAPRPSPATKQPTYSNVSDAELQRMVAAFGTKAVEAAAAREGWQVTGDGDDDTDEAPQVPTSSLNIGKRQIVGHGIDAEELGRIVDGRHDRGGGGSARRATGYDPFA